MRVGSIDQRSDGSNGTSNATPLCPSSSLAVNRAFAISSSYRAAVFGYSPAVVHPTLQEFSMRMRTLLLFVIVLSALPLLAIDIHDTRLLSEPAVSGDRIAFGYANDLWVANLDGSGVRRLTSHPGIEAGAPFSPRGKGVALPRPLRGHTRGLR